ncbi:MAG: hypothetical protein H7174_13265 [Flavobacterium sp.]|nr:hypothetical protein [Flavobacterium sp.]
MRKLFIVLAVVFAVFGIVLTILPTEKLGLIPVGLAFVFAFFSLQKSKMRQKKLPQFVLIFSVILILTALAKIFLAKDEVIIDQKDEIIKIESQKQDQKDLEELDDL